MTRKELSEKIERLQMLMSSLGKELTEAQRELDGFTNSDEEAAKSWVTIEIASEFYGVCQETIFRWINHGCPFVMTSSRRRIGRICEIESWVKKFKPQVYKGTETKEWKKAKAIIDAKHATPVTNSPQKIPA